MPQQPLDPPPSSAPPRARAGTPALHASPAAPSHGVSFGEGVRTWLRIGLNSFGGPAGQIAMMHRVCVEEKRWVSEERFLHALNYCMLLPGPEAQQLAVYIGWLLHGTAGGLVAGTLFVLPGVVSILALSILYAGWGAVTLVSGLFFGLKAAVLAVVIEAGLRIGRRALRNRTMVGLAALAFVLIFFLGVPFPAIVLGAGLVGLLGARIAPQAFAAQSHRGPAGAGAPSGGTSAPAAPAAHAAPATHAAHAAPAALATHGASPLHGARAAGEAVPHRRVDEWMDDNVPEHTRPSAARAVRVLVTCLLLWLGPVIGLALLRGPDDTYAQIGSFFSRAAVVTFGGAYAVLPYVAQQAVERFGWLTPGEMLQGLGLAETTPGPLIMVVQFVGFLAAFRDPGSLPPMLAGTLGGLLTTWVTFVPCFLWIFLGAPWIEALRGQRALSSALGAITAAVVGVVLNLAVWFAVHVLFAVVETRHAGPLSLLVPVPSSLDVPALVLSVFAVLALFRWKLGMLKTLGLCAAAGAVWTLLAR
jgi:chromate transporter